MPDQKAEVTAIVCLSFEAFDAVMSVLGIFFQLHREDLPALVAQHDRLLSPMMNRKPSGGSESQ